MAAARKKSEEIAEHIELAILSGRLSVGDKIPSERVLMDQFGVGRSTVREALFNLQRKGLLETRAGAAARVSRPDADTLVRVLSGAARHMLAQPDGIRHLQSARRLFEMGLARQAAIEATEEDLRVSFATGRRAPAQIPATSAKPRPTGWRRQLAPSPLEAHSWPKLRRVTGKTAACPQHQYLAC